MRRLLLKIAVLGAALTLAPATVGAAGSYRPRSRGPVEKSRVDMKPARKVESLPSSIDIRRGQKRSFKVTGTVAAMDPKMIRLAVNDKKVMTVVGLKEGNTQIFVFDTGGKGPPSAAKLQTPRRIPVRVLR